ncbi:MAG: DUF2911 domain-containing protein [Bryobacteraceae bacterium]
MKRSMFLALAMAVAFTAGLAQTPKDKFNTPNPKSPPRQTSVTINGKEVWIAYHAPSVRSRTIFGADGALHPNGSNWRLGADQATFLHTDADLDIGGVAIPAGEYTLFVALNEGKWELIINKQTGQWGIKRGGAANFDPANNAGTAPLSLRRSPALVEELKIELTHAGGNKAKLEIAWEHANATIGIVVK